MSEMCTAVTTERSDWVIQPQRTTQRCHALTQAIYEVIGVGFVALHKVATPMRRSSLTALKVDYLTVLPALYDDAQTTPSSDMLLPSRQ